MVRATRVLLALLALWAAAGVACTGGDSHSASTVSGAATSVATEASSSPATASTLPTPVPYVSIGHQDGYIVGLEGPRGVDANERVYDRLVVVAPDGIRRTVEPPAPVAALFPTLSPDVVYLQLKSSVSGGPAAFFNARNGTFLLVGQRVKAAGLQLNFGFDGPRVDYYVVDRSDNDDRTEFAVDLRAWTMTRLEPCVDRTVSADGEWFIDLSKRTPECAGVEPGHIGPTKAGAERTPLVFNAPAPQLDATSRSVAPGGGLAVLSGFDPQTATLLFVAIDRVTGTVRRLAGAGGTFVGWVNPTIALVAVDGGVDLIDVPTGQRSLVRPPDPKAASRVKWCLPPVRPDVLIRSEMQGDKRTLDLQLFDLAGNEVGHVRIEANEAPTCGSSDLFSRIAGPVLWNASPLPQSAPYAIDAAAKKVSTFRDQLGGPANGNGFADGPNGLAVVNVDAGNRLGGYLLRANGEIRKISDSGWFTAQFSPSGTSIVASDVVSRAGDGATAVLNLDGNVLLELPGVASPVWLRA
jgi:hypothetical protein